MKRTPVTLTVAGLALLTVAGTVSVMALPQSAPSGSLSIRAVSTDAALVTGGDVLVQVSLPAGTAGSTARVTVGGRDITAAFHPGPTANTLQGVVTGLPVGPA